MYGTSEVYTFLPYRLRWIRRWFYRRGRSIDLEILTKLGKRLIYHPSGCKDQALQQTIRQRYPYICGNCGWAAKACDDEVNDIALSLKNRYGSLIIPSSLMPSDRIDQTIMKYRSLDLNLWNGEVDIPSGFQLAKSSRIRIMHSFFDSGRRHGGKNIKGSPFIFDAVERLREEGHPVEYFYVNNISMRDMRYYQAQADIIVDQIIYGWWGSTAAEGMALGKPVVCYLHPEWKKEFLKAHPEYEELPIVEANTTNIYEVLKRLVVDSRFRKERGRASRTFAEQHFDVKKNALLLEQKLLSL